MNSKTAGRRLAGTAALVAATAAIAATPAAAATSVYPSGGSSFTTSADGWTGSDRSCTLLGGIGSVCNAETDHAPTVGNPQGSISARTNVLVNLLALFRGQSKWSSPEFTLPSAAVTGGTLQIDRRFDVGGLLAIGPVHAYSVKLADVTSGVTTTVTTEALDNDDDDFVTRTATVPTGALVAGHNYRLVLDNTTTTTILSLGVLGTTNARFDNARLVVQDASGDNPTVTPGVTIQSGPLTDIEINTLLSSINVNAEFGSLPGGSVVPAAKCTILGTPGADRITGTSGNDVICGLGGNDTLRGGGGRDIIDTGDGNDTAIGHGGNDALIGVRGNDRMLGGAGADRIGGGAGKDRVGGESGNDRLDSGSGNDRVSGGRGKDRLATRSGNDRVNGGKGKDRIAAGSGRDRISARDRTRDAVDGGPGRDRASVDRVASAGRRGVSRRRADRVRRVERLR